MLVATHSTDFVTRLWVEISSLKDTELECSHTVKLRNLVPKVFQSKKRTERKKAITNLFLKRFKRNAIPRISALVRILSVQPHHSCARGKPLSGPPGGRGLSRCSWRSQTWERGYRSKIHPGKERSLGKTAIWYKTKCWQYLMHQPAVQLG